LIAGKKLPLIDKLSGQFRQPSPVRYIKIDNPVPEGMSNWTPISLLAKAEVI
jgi:hypothetical protein